MIKVTFHALGMLFRKRSHRGPPPARGEQRCQHCQDSPKPSRGTQQTHYARKKTSPSSKPATSVPFTRTTAYMYIYAHTHIDEYRWTLSMYSSIHPPTPNYYRCEMGHAVQACQQNQHRHLLKSNHGVMAASQRKETTACCRAVKCKDFC